MICLQSIIYRKIQYQTAAVRYNRKELKDLYAVDQLTAMKWADLSWRQVTKETIQNCFIHTGLCPASDKKERLLEAVTEENKELMEDLNAILQSVHGNETSITDLDIVPEEEMQVVHEQRSPEEILNDVLRHESQQQGIVIQSNKRTEANNTLIK